MSTEPIEIFPYGCIGPGEQTITVQADLIGVGDDAIRMGKRLKCAATALGIGMDIRWIKKHKNEPITKIGGEIFLDRLTNTEHVEQRLRTWMREHEAKSL